MLTNVGLAMFNNWRSRCTSEELQEKQRAFQKAAQQRNSERMLQLLREGQAINEEIEKELHSDRLKNIETDFDDLITKVFASQAIQSWPLRVLPMVMKNESLGTKIFHAQDSIALHCIFTPSNSATFNRAVFAGIDQGLEKFCNNNLNDMSAHPVIYYSGAWRSNTAPTGPEISLLKSKLPNIPTLVITPFFPPDKDMVIQVYLWGVGTEQYLEITLKDLSYSYNRNTEFDEDLINTTIEEFVPFIACTIGYLSDSYFWSFYGRSPILPSLLSIGAINTDGMASLLKGSKEQYTALIPQSLDSSMHIKPFDIERQLNLFEGIMPILEESDRIRLFVQITEAFFNERGILPKNESACIDWCDLPILSRLYSLSLNLAAESESKNISSVIESVIKRYSPTTQTVITLSLQDVLINARELFSTSTNDDTLHIFINKEEHSVLVYYDSSAFCYNAQKYFASVKYNCNRFLLPPEFLKKTHLSVIKDKISKLVQDMAFQCTDNAFFTILSFDDVIDLCKSKVNGGIKECEIIRNIREQDITIEHPRFTNDELAHMLLCRVWLHSGEQVEFLTFADDLSVDFKRVFGDSNIIKVS